MTKEGSAKLAFILSLIAASLALAAALVEYMSKGNIKVSLIAAAIFLLALGFGARSRIAPDK